MAAESSDSWKTQKKPKENQNIMRYFWFSSPDFFTGSNNLNFKIDQRRQKVPIIFKWSSLDPNDIEITFPESNDLGILKPQSFIN